MRQFPFPASPLVAAGAAVFPASPFSPVFAGVSGFCSAGFLPASSVAASALRSTNPDFRAVAQFVQPVYHDDLSRFEAFLDNGVFTGCGAYFHFRQRDGLVFVDPIDVMAELAQLDGNGRDRDGIGLRAEMQAHVDELVREKLMLFVVEFRFQADRAGIGAQLVVDGEDRAFGQFVPVVPVPCLDREVRVGRTGFQYLRKIDFRYGENDVDRLFLRDGDDAVGIGGVHDIAEIDLSQADAAGNRSGDAAVGELKFRVVDRTLIEPDGAFILFDEGGLRIDLLLAIEFCSRS